MIYQKNTTRSIIGAFIKARYVFTLLFSSMVFLSFNSHAQTTCNIASPSDYVATLPGSTINVGGDLPVGSVIYNFTTSLVIHSGVNCRTDTPPQNFQVPVMLDYLMTPLPLSGYAGGNWVARFTKLFVCIILYFAMQSALSGVMQSGLSPHSLFSFPVRSGNPCNQH